MVAKRDFLEYLTGDVQPFELPGGMVVKIRPLTLAERERIRLQSMNGADGDVDTVTLEIHTVIEGLVEPKLDVADAEALAKAKAGYIDLLAQEIMEMSGMGEDIEKKAGNGS